MKIIPKIAIFFLLGILSAVPGSDLRAVTVRVSPIPNPQFSDASGRPLAGGHLCTYAAGTTTPLATYTDSTGTTQNGVCIGPGFGGIVLDAGGRASIWLVPGSAYKFVLYDSKQNLQWSQDNILIDSAANPATYNVKNYGATGDGATNDYTAIANAISAACQNNTGGTIAFPPGTYASGSTLVLSNSCPLILAGSGQQASTLKYTGTGDAVSMQFGIIAPFTSDAVRDLTISAGATATAIHQMDTAGATYDNVTTSGANIGWLIDDHALFNERTRFRNCTANLNNTGWKFVNTGSSQPSFRYTYMLASHVQIPNSGIGLQLFGVTVDNSSFQLTYNGFGGASAGTAIKLTKNGTTPAVLSATQLFIEGEGATTRIAVDDSNDGFSPAGFLGGYSTNGDSIAAGATFTYAGASPTPGSNTPQGSLWVQRGSDYWGIPGSCGETTFPTTSAAVGDIALSAFASTTVPACVYVSTGNPGSAFTVTGMHPGYEGRVVFLVNATAYLYSMTLVHADSGTTAADRFFSYKHTNQTCAVAILTYSAPNNFWNIVGCY